MTALAPSQVLVTHEAIAGRGAVGVVTQTGDAASFLAGQRVLVGAIDPCGECDVCRRGRVGACPHQRQGAAREARWLCALAGPLEGAVPGPTAAVLAHEAALLYTMFARAGVAPGETTRWFGDPARRELGARIARAKGAVVVEDGPATHVFEASGEDSSRAAALDVVAPGGTLVFAAERPAGSLPLGRALAAEATLLGVVAPHPDLLPELVALVVRGELAIDDLVTIIPASDGTRAAELARAGRFALVVLG